MKKTQHRRTSKQREIILQQLKKMRSHPTACALYLLVRKKIPSVSFATVYRNLNLLRDEGRILELSCGKYRSHYDGIIENHSHFFCLSCQNVFDGDSIEVSDETIRVNQKSGFKVVYHRLDFYGYCAGCSNSKS
jgi:Fur family transcriptional regulator, peroxide stress response regulator